MNLNFVNFSILYYIGIAYRCQDFYLTPISMRFIMLGNI